MKLTKMERDLLQKTFEQQSRYITANEKAMSTGMAKAGYAPGVTAMPVNSEKRRAVVQRQLRGRGFLKPHPDKERWARTLVLTSKGLEALGKTLPECNPSPAQFKWGAIVISPHNRVYRVKDIEWDKETDTHRYVLQGLVEDAVLVDLTGFREFQRDDKIGKDLSIRVASRLPEEMIGIGTIVRPKGDFTSDIPMRRISGTAHSSMPGHYRIMAYVNQSRMSTPESLNHYLVFEEDQEAAEAPAEAS